jgi:hypothetical protein
VNVRLRPARPADRAWRDAWLPAVTERFGYKREAGASQFVFERDGERAGVVCVRPEKPERDAATIELVATPLEQARRGTALRAVALLEERLRRQRVGRVYAPAPAAHGISVYFWLRLGYRPLLRPEWPCAGDDVMWLRRELV